MNPLQNLAVRIALSDHNLLLTGNCGTGKTFVMKKIVSKLKETGKNVAVTGSTGLSSALFKEFSGSTIHRWCGLTVTGQQLSYAQVLEKIQTNKELLHIKKADALLIDEIGMISVRTFGLIEFICRNVRDIDEHFGGLQVIASGSFTQLPPVPTVGDPGIFCFENSIFKDLFIHHVHLTSIVRTREKDLAFLVQELETGNPSTKSEKLLQTLKRPIENPAGATVLVGTNFAVDCHNHQQMHTDPEVGESVKRYFAVDEGKGHVLHRCPASKVLALKVGVPVVLLKNLSPDFVNGLRGTVHQLDDSPVIDFQGKLLKLQQYNFAYQGGRRLQYPIKVSYALTVHRAQGQTLDKVIVDCKDFFAPGQLAVAVGRATTKEGLQVINYDSSIGSLKHSTNVYDFLQKESLTLETGDVKSWNCCKRYSPVHTSDLPSLESKSQSVTFSCDVHEGPSVYLEDRYKNVLGACRLPENTTQQIELNVALDSLHYNAQTNVFLTTVEEKCTKLLQELQAVQKRKSESMKSQIALEVYSNMTSYLATSEFDEICKELFGSCINKVQRKLCSQIVMKYMDCHLSETVHQMKDTVVETVAEQPALPSVLPESFRSKLRYIAGATVAKLKWRRKVKVTGYLSKNVPIDMESINMMDKVFQQVVARETELIASTKDPGSLQEILQNQGQNRGLTNVTDECYDFFELLHHKAYALDLQSEIFQKQKSLQQVASCLAVDDTLCEKWFSLFQISDDESEDDKEVLMHSFIYCVYEEICEYFIKVYSNEFITAAKDKLVHKKQSLRSSLKGCAKRKEVEVDQSSICKKKKKKPVAKVQSVKDTVISDEIVAEENGEICGICDLLCVDYPTCDNEQSIGCEQCNKWFHWHCVGVTKISKCVLQPDEPWSCTVCENKRSRAKVGRKGRSKAKK